MKDKELRARLIATAIRLIRLKTSAKKNPRKKSELNTQLIRDCKRAGLKPCDVRDIASKIWGHIYKGEWDKAEPLLEEFTGVDSEELKDVA